MRACRSPAVFITSRTAEQGVGHHQPQPAEQRKRRQPVQRAAGVGAAFDREAVDHGAYHHTRLKVAKTEPQMNALSQMWRFSGFALKRNSKATPRKISPISISVSGMASASRITE